MKDRKEATVYS